MVTEPDRVEKPWISAGQFRDIDAQAAQLHGYGQQYQQLSGGAFEGCFRSFVFGDDLGIHFEMANRTLAQSAWTPRGRYAVCLLGEASPSCTLNAAPFTANHIALSPESKVLEGTTSAGMNICCIDIASALLPDEEYGMRQARRVQILADAHFTRQLRELIDSALTTFTVLRSLAAYPAAVQGFKASLGDLLWHVGNESLNRDAASANRRACARTLQVFTRAREYIHIHEGLTDGMSIVALCKAVGVSRRSLECAFRSVIGMGPGNYVRTLQLNHIRRDLIANTRGNVSIGVIAARRGIWHWSRFSSHYRQLFGELPSQTRERTMAARVRRADSSLDPLRFHC